MNPFLQPPDVCLTEWSAFRKGLKDRSEQEQLDSVAAYFAKTPLVKIAYDPDDPTAWPTPWEMIHRNEWDRDSIAVIMDATLRLIGWDTSRLCIMRVDDRSDLRSVVGVDQKVVLNYDWGSVTPLPPKGWHVRQRWRFTGRLYAEF